MTKAWVNQWFSAKAATTGGVIRRRIDYVEQYASLDEIEAEARARGWHVVVIGEQVMVICATGQIEVIC